MFSLNNQLELRKVTISSLISCIYLPSIITFISFKGLLYSVGNISSFYILVLIFIAELLKSLYLSSNEENQLRRGRPSRSRTGEFMKSLVFITCIQFGFFVGVILFGAPVLDNHEETLMLASLLTLLTVFPLIIHSGVETAMQLMFGVKTYARNTAIDMLMNNAVLTICGAWVGAVVIPLDWNTPWQQWPIPCYLGAICGYLLSNVLSILKVTLMSASNKYPLCNTLVNVMNRLYLSGKSY